jgi:hypothetical protein
VFDQKLLDIPIVKQHITEAAGEIARFEAASFEEYMYSKVDDRSSIFAPNLESPLEALFFVWWHSLAGQGRVWGEKFVLFTQQPVDAQGVSYRLDFVVGLTVEWREWFDERGVAWPRIAVEVDGHAFHEKTAEQVAARNTRDRLLQQAGWIVFHFSWSELTTRPLECAGEVLGVARGYFQQLILVASRNKAKTEVEAKDAR